LPAKIRQLTPAESAHIHSDFDEAAGDSAEKPSWGSLLRYKQTWSFIFAKFMTDPIWWFFLIWLPDYFKKTRGLDIKKSWVHLVTIYAIITVLSIIGGWVTGYLTKGGWTVTRARKTGMFIFACCVVADFLRDQSGRLARGPAYQSRGCGASGVVGKSFHDSVRHVSEACSGLGGGVGWIGRSDRWNVFPHLLRTDAGQVHRCGKCDRGLRDIVFNLRVCLSGYLRAPSFSRSEISNLFR